MIKAIKDAYKNSIEGQSMKVLTKNRKYYVLGEADNTYLIVDDLGEVASYLKCWFENRNKKDMVNHPQHYNKGKYEVIDVIEDWGLGFSLGNAIKYIARCEHKGNKKQDLEKAIFYLKRELERENSDEK